MARVPRSSRAARKRAQDRRRLGNARPVASRNHPQGCTWTGVRERARGRWAAEIRVPGTRAKLWIGSFEQALHAALAYDAALFCFYGARRLPSLGRFNFPTAPHPDISEDVRATPTPTNIKDIAESHVRTLASFFVGPLPAASLAVASPPPPPAATTMDGCNGNCIG